MPPRLSKRQQRELEELQALGSPSHEANSSSEDESTPSFPPKSTTGFAALYPAEEPHEDHETEDEDPSGPTKPRKPKKKKKKATVIDADNPPVANITGLPSPASQKPKGQTKKSKAKEKKSDKDDLDQALAELSIQYPYLQQASSSTSTPSTPATSTRTLASLLSVSLQHLDSEAEMRKFFGSKVISAAKSSSSSPSGSARRQPTAVQKSHLTRPQPSWLLAKQREGLSIRVYDKDDVEKKLLRQDWLAVEEKWWTVEYSKRYKSVTKDFMRAVVLGDPDEFWRVLQIFPWHADTLLQLSEVFRHREEYSQAVDFVERALFTYERSFIGTFNFTSGQNRLDFDRVENRPFFLALHRQVADLQRRGCVRTAFEFARLLYSLDPWSDPHGALLHLDYVAIKSGMGQWLLDVWDFFDGWWKADQHLNRSNVTLLPGWSYARALALRAKEDVQKDKNHEASDAALREAIQTFPEIIPLLADKIDINLSTEIRRHRVFQIVTEVSPSSTSHDFLHLLSHIYAQRSSPLWKDPKRASWFANTVTDIFPRAQWSHTRRDHFLQYYTDTHHRYSAYRHIMTLESGYRSLFAFIPRETLPIRQWACDPLPPPRAVNRYCEEFFKGTDDPSAGRSRIRRSAEDQRLMERVFPDPLIRLQLEALLDAAPGLQQRFPGGVAQIIEMAENLPEDAFDELVMRNERQDRNLPGAMPGEIHMFADDIDDDINVPAQGHPPVPIQDEGGPGQTPRGANISEDEYESSEEEEAPPLPLRLLRNIMNRFWGLGGNSNTDAEDTSSEDNDIGIHPTDDGGVD